MHLGKVCAFTANHARAAVEICMMRDQSETAFLKRLMACTESPERERLEIYISEVEKKVNCVRRGVWLVGFPLILSAVGLGYCVILGADYPSNMTRFASQLLPRSLFALALASTFCLGVFSTLLFIYRKELYRAQNQARGLVTKHFESRLPNSPEITPNKAVPPASR